MDLSSKKKIVRKTRIEFVIEGEKGESEELITEKGEALVQLAREQLNSEYYVSDSHFSYGKFVFQITCAEGKGHELDSWVKEKARALKLNAVG